MFILGPGPVGRGPAQGPPSARARCAKRGVLSSAGRQAGGGREGRPARRRCWEGGAGQRRGRGAPASSPNAVPARENRPGQPPGTTAAVTEPRVGEPRMVADVPTLGSLGGGGLGATLQQFAWSEALLSLDLLCVPAWLCRCSLDAKHSYPVWPLGSRWLSGLMPGMSYIYLSEALQSFLFAPQSTIPK